MSRTSQRTAAPPSDRRAARLAGLRYASLAALIMVIIEYALGTGVNLYVNIPASGSAGQAFSHGPLLAIHTAFGLLLVITGISVLLRAIIVKRRAVIVIATVGLLAIIAGAGYGASFMQKGTTSASLGMAMAAAVAMLSYTLALFIVRVPR